MKRRHELSDEKWAQIEPLLPGRVGAPGRPGMDNRRFVNAIVWIAKTGVPWRDLPETFGKWNSVFQRYNRWCKRGVWQRVFEALGDDPDLELLLPNCAIVRAHQDTAGTNGTRATKRSAVLALDGARRSTPPQTSTASRST